MQAARPGRMLLLSGPSGCGKSTICKRLLTDPRVVFSVSATTRAARPGEVDELLVRQSGIEKQLYEIQRVVALTLEDVYRLEALLAAVERERYGMPPAKP